MTRPSQSLGTSLMVKENCIAYGEGSRTRERYVPYLFILLLFSLNFLSLSMAVRFKKACTGCNCSNLVNQYINLFCLSVCLSVCLSLFLSVCLFVCLSVCLSASVRLFGCLSVCMPFSQFVYLFVCLSVCRLSVYIVVSNVVC